MHPCTVKQAQAMIRTLVKTKDIFVDEKLNLVMIKDTADAVRLAERLIESLDMAEPEVMLDVEVLEVTRSRLLELGVRFPDQIGYGRLQPDLNTTIVKTKLGKTMMIQWDEQLPRPYTRHNFIQGTKGAFGGFPDRVLQPAELVDQAELTR